MTMTHASLTRVKALRVTIAALMLGAATLTAGLASAKPVSLTFTSLYSQDKPQTQV